MKHILIPCIIFICCSFSLYAQNIERDNVSIRYIRKPLKTLPEGTNTYCVQLTPRTTTLGNYVCQPHEAENIKFYGYYRLDSVFDADIIISSNMRSELAVTDIKAEKGTYIYQKDKDSPKIPYTAFVYAISYKAPELYYSIKTNKKGVIEENTIGGNIEKRYFGNTSYEDHYSSDYQLAAAWREVRSSYLKQWEQDAYNGAIGYVQSLYRTYCLHWWNNQVSIKYVKEKKENKYQDLREAKNKFSEAVAYIKTDTICLINKYVEPDHDKKTALLKEAIAIWEAALAEADYDNRKARIDQKVARHLYYNISVGYLMLGDFNKAQQFIQGRKDEETEKLLLKNAFAGLEALASFIDDQKTRGEANTWRILLTSYDTPYVYKDPATRLREMEQQQLAQKRIQDSINELNKPKKSVAPQKKTTTPKKGAPVKKPTNSATKKPE